MSELVLIFLHLFKDVLRSYMSGCMVRLHFELDKKMKEADIIFIVHQLMFNRNTRF